MAADALYVHVPFCRKICAYCDFCHVLYQEEMAARWLKAIAEEAAGRLLTADLKTIYIGGGTPSALSCPQLDILLTMLDPFADKVSEYTVEVNPESLDEEKAACMVRHGVNRVSLGYQTNDTQLLHLMNRDAGLYDVERALTFLREAGITNISLDVLYSLPTQTMARLQEAVTAALMMEPTHLSLYSLTIEPHTVFAAKKLEPCSPDLEADMYEWIVERLSKAGFEQYELSNFARPGYASRHNCIYWEYGDFYGIGCGAAGKENDVRYEHTRDLRAYLQNPTALIKTHLSEAERMFETVMMGMRLRKGMNTVRFAKRYGRRIQDVYPRSLAFLMEHALIEPDVSSVLRATKRGYAILNSVLDVFLAEKEGELANEEMLCVTE